MNATTPPTARTILKSSLVQPPNQQQQQQQHLVMIGGGHAHVQVIQALRRQTNRHQHQYLRVTVIDSLESATYSGMVPGCITGVYAPSETLLPIRQLATMSTAFAAAHDNNNNEDNAEAEDHNKYYIVDMRFVCGTVVDIDLDQKLIHWQQLSSSKVDGNDNQPPEPPALLAFDVVSIDIGSTSKGYDTCPGAARYAIPTRPIHALIARLDAARIELVKEREKNDSKETSSSSSISNNNNRNKRSRPPQLVIIGGGVAGIELAMSITGRWTIQDGMSDLECTILDSGRELLASEPSSVRDAVRTVLDSRTIRVRQDSQVTRIDEGFIHLAGGGDPVPFTHCIWATGAGAHGLATHLRDARGLECSESGFISVRPTLQSTSHPFVFAAGDCANILLPQQNRTIPKAGVYAVRSGPILIENLTRYLDSISRQIAISTPDGPCATATTIRDERADLQMFEPQDDFMKLLVCGDGTALGFRFGLVLRGKWVFELKDNIDKSFMNLFDVNDISRPTRSNSKYAKAESAYDIRQYDDPLNNEGQLPDLLEAQQAAELLQQTDDHVDFQQAKVVLREMGSNASYRTNVLQHIHHPNCLLNQS